VIKLGPSSKTWRIRIMNYRKMGKLDVNMINAVLKNIEYDEEKRILEACLEKIGKNATTTL